MGSEGTCADKKFAPKSAAQPWHIKLGLLLVELTAPESVLQNDEFFTQDEL